MARKDIVTIKGASTLCLNIDGAVGLGARNDPGDVMVVQAYLRYIHPLVMQWLADQPGDVPAAILAKVNGIYDSDTSRALQMYCGFRMGTLLKPDGKVHPANYFGRNIKNPHGKLMVITRMHLDAQVAQRQWGHPNYIQEMMKRDPFLAVKVRPWASPLSNLLGNLYGV